MDRERGRKGRMEGLRCIYMHNVAQSRRFTYRVFVIIRHPEQAISHGHSRTAR